jgi:hypothetical protein
LTLYRLIFPEWSERTIARYAASKHRLDVIGKSPDEQVAMIKTCSRPNGTIDVARLAEWTEALAAFWIVKHFPRVSVGDTEDASQAVGASGEVGR